ncbi:pleckstrin homology domain-containing family F member 1 [Alosa sapidissima]|uniref:pleckstrin homology domain-containing family F member 1 n=1 Tax=Alosa sapidissima TaxID=34773 RepID=UPI001C09A8BA|nr:pleckstrin homology domain-containing family F member 1 [Alosa sapidissima]
MVDQTPFEQKNRERIQAVENSFGPSGKSLMEPGRVLVGEGRLLKLCRRRPQQKVFYLFNDILIYGSIILHGRWHKRQQVIQLEEVEQEDLEDGLGMANQWLLRTPRKSFSVAAASLEEKQAWMEHIEECRLQQIERLGLKSEKRGSFAASWIPDRASAICMRCSNRFGVTQRRHHCRRCGFIVCNTCSKGRAVLENISRKPVRVCQQCMATMQGEQQQGQTQGDSWNSRNWHKGSVEDKQHTLPDDDVSSGEECEEPAESHAPTQWVSMQDGSCSPYCYFNPDHLTPPGLTA